VQDVTPKRCDIDDMKIIRGVLGFLAGYAVVVLVTTYGFGILDGHKPYHRAGFLIASAAVAVAVTAGLAGGAIAAAIAQQMWSGILVAVPLIVESTWLIFIRSNTADFSRPFELIGATTLIGCTVAGAVLTSRIRLRRRQPSSALSS
jgi:hypothetical protein